MRRRYRMNKPVIVLAEQNPIVRSRIRDILADHEIKIQEAYNRDEVLRILAESQYNVDLIISEIEIDTDDDFDGIALIQLAKKKRSSIPVVILTSVSQKDVITRYLREGAADYILKPFEDEYLKQKILKYINIETLTEMTVLKFNLKNFLEGEIYKARKGKYPFSLLMVRFNSSQEDEETSQNHVFYNFAESLYKSLSSLFWESDLYIQHGFQSHLGFFPFCDQAHTETIITKLNAKFAECKAADPGMKNYEIFHAFATYPADGETSQELLNTLAERTKESLRELGEK